MKQITLLSQSKCHRTTIITPMHHPACLVKCKCRTRYLTVIHHADHIIITRKSSFRVLAEETQISALYQGPMELFKVMTNEQLNTTPPQASNEQSETQHCIVHRNINRRHDPEHWTLRKPYQHIRAKTKQNRGARVKKKKKQKRGSRNKTAEHFTDKTRIEPPKLINLWHEALQQRL